MEINLIIEKTISGYPEYGVKGDETSILAISHSPIINRPHPYITPEVIKDINGFKTGDLYLFRGYTKIQTQSGNVSILMKPLYEGGPMYSSVENINDFNLDGERWDKLRENIEVIEQNRHTFTSIAVKDMSKLPNMQEVSRSYFLTDGRWIDINDYNAKNRACVIYYDLANARGLKVGDKISLKHTEATMKYIFTDKERENWKDYKTTEPIEYEIVGIFKHKDEFMGGAEEWVFVPESTVPEGFIDKNDIYYSSYSFLLKTSRDEKKFLQEYTDKIKELGYNLTFVDSNAREFWNNAESMKRASINNTLVFGVLLLIAMLFTLYLHFQDFKRVYAIERTLGIPKKTARVHIVNPILIKMAIITMIITLFCRFDSIRQVEKQLSELIEGTGTKTAITISPLFLILIFIVIMLTFTIFVYFFMRSLENRSIIELIQMGEVQKKKKSSIEVQDDLKADIELQGLKQVPSMAGMDFKYKTAMKDKVLNKFIGRQITRSKLQTSLLILLALIFTFSILWLNQLVIMNKKQIENAFRNTEIDADFYSASNAKVYTGFNGVISQRILDEIELTNLVKETSKKGIAKYTKVYIKENGEEKLLNENDEAAQVEKYSVLFSNQLIDNEGNLKLEEVTLNEGINPSLLNDKWHYTKKEDDVHFLENEKGETRIPILASDMALEMYGLKIGDEISFDSGFRRINRVYGTIVGKFVKQSDHAYKDGTFEGYGISPLFVMPLDVMDYVEKGKLHYEKVNVLFDKEKNNELYFQANAIKEMIANHEDNKTSVGLKIWDEELRKVIVPLEKNLSLLEIVYPITIVISLLTAGFVAYIINLRKAKDMAILRVLGVSNREVKALSIKESLLLTLIGVLFGVLLMIVLRKIEYSIGTTGYILAAGSYTIGTILGLMLALKNRDSKKPLELLQVKE